MSQPLMVSIPHRLGRQEAKRRLDGGIARLSSELSAFVTTLDYGWHGDILNLNAQAMRQTITGRVEVMDDAVRIEIDLPWLLRLLGNMIGKQARDRAALMLEKSRLRCTALLVRRTPPSTVRPIKIRPANLHAVVGPIQLVAPCRPYQGCNRQDDDEHHDPGGYELGRRRARRRPQRQAIADAQIDRRPDLLGMRVAACGLSRYFRDRFIHAECTRVSSTIRRDRSDR
jgi:hypothetical protein